MAQKRMAICGGRDFEAPTYPLVLHSLIYNIFINTEKSKGELFHLSRFTTFGLKQSFAL